MTLTTEPLLPAHADLCAQMSTKKRGRPSRTPRAAAAAEGAGASAEPVDDSATDADTEGHWDFLMSLCLSPYRHQYYNDLDPFLFDKCMSWLDRCQQLRFMPTPTCGHVCSPDCAKTFGKDLPISFCHESGNVHECGADVCTCLAAPDDRSGSVCTITGRFVALDMVAETFEEGRVYERDYGHSKATAAAAAAAAATTATATSSDAAEVSSSSGSRGRSRRRGRGRALEASVHSMGHPDFGRSFLETIGRKVLDQLVFSKEARHLSGANDEVLHIPPEDEEAYYDHCEQVRQLIVNSSEFRLHPQKFAPECICVMVLTQWLKRGFEARPLFGLQARKFFAKYAVEPNYVSKFRIDGRPIIESKITDLDRALSVIIIRWHNLRVADYPRCKWIPAALVKYMARLARGEPNPEEDQRMVEKALLAREWDCIRQYLDPLGTHVTEL